MNGRGFNFRFGSVFSLIIIFFIYLFAYNQTQILGHHAGWDFLAFVAKWYLIIVVAITLFIILIPIIIVLLAAFFLWISRKRKKKTKHRKGNVIDADYEVKK